MTGIKMQVWPSDDGWRVRSVGGNGEIVLAGEALEYADDAEQRANDYAPPGALVQILDSDEKVVRDYPARRKDMLAGDAEQLSKVFDLHPPTNPEVAARMDAMRAGVKGLGEQIMAELPNSRERSLALTHLEQVGFFAIAAIARNQ